MGLSATPRKRPTWPLALALGCLGSCIRVGYTGHPAASDTPAPVPVATVANRPRDFLVFGAMSNPQSIAGDTDAGLEGDASSGQVAGDAGDNLAPLIGIWFGNVMGGGTYATCMTIAQVSEEGSPGGTIDYSAGYNCGGPGNLTFVSANGTGGATFYEYFPQGGVCSLLRSNGVDGHIETALNGDGTLDWQWFSPRTGTRVTWGTLARVSACP